MNARRRRDKWVIYEDNEERRGDDRALGYTSIYGVQIGEETVHSDGNSPIREETTNPINESVMETKHRQFSEKTLVRENAINGLGVVVYSKSQGTVFDTCHCQLNVCVAHYPSSKLCGKSSRIGSVGLQ